MSTRFALALLTTQLFCLPVFSVSAQISHQDLSRFENADGQVELIRTPQDWGKRRQAILKGFQQATGPLPSRDDLPDLELQIATDEDYRGVRRLSGSIQAEVGDRLPLDIYLPAGEIMNAEASSLLGESEDKSVPGILALHPTGAAGKRIVAGEKSNRQYAIEMAQRGYVVVAPDYVSFGDYANYDFAGDTYNSGTMKGIFNHMRCVDLLSAMRCVDEDRIAVIGHSLGGHNAIFVSVFDERIDVTVSSCGWTPFHDYYGGKLQGWTSDRYMPRIRTEFDLDPDKVPFDFYELVAALAPRPFVSVSPVSDSNFDVAGVRKAVPKAGQIYKLLGNDKGITLLTPECEHDFPTDMRLASYELIDQVFGFQSTPIDPDYSTELPRIGPTEPVDAAATFQTIAGYQLQQTACEPQVTDPVALTFDEDGRLYVVEMKGYSEQADELRGQVRLLEDKDQDGVFETSRVFASGFSWPTAIAPYDGGVFVGAAPDIFYLRDTNSDGSADKRDIVFTGFGKGNVQGLLNSFHWGQDGRIYGATSSSGGEILIPSAPKRAPIKLRSRDFSFNPRALDLRDETGGAQHGMSFDDYGNRFVCSNSNHAQAILFDQRYLAANPYVKPAAGRVTIAVDGGQAPVFRTSPVEPWRIVRTRLRVSGRVRGPVEGGGTPAGYFTGATGITVYRGDAWPDDMRGNLVIGDVGSNIVHRKRREASGVTWTATRIDSGKELVSSTDVWFRPVQFANAPDGCLHILDMYRETIEHPASLPPEIKRHVDLTSGRDRGRLYRIAPDGYVYRPTPRLSQASTAELVSLLAHSNGWHADTASRLLYEQNDSSMVKHIRESLRPDVPPTGIVRMLSLLAGQHALDADTVIAWSTHAHPRVRERAVLLSESLLSNARVLEAVSRRVSDEDARVRLQAGFSLGTTESAERIQPLVALLRTAGQDSWIRTAALTSLRDGVWQAVELLVDDAGFLALPSASDILSETIDLALRRPDGPDAANAVSAIQRIPGSRTMQRNLLTLMLNLKQDWRQLAEPAALRQEIVRTASADLTNPEASVPARLDAIRAIGLSTWAAHGMDLLELLSPTEPPRIQSAAMQTIAGFADVSAAKAILGRWRELTPAIRRQALSALLNRTQWTRLLLANVNNGDIEASVLSSADLSRLAKHSDQAIRSTADELAASSNSSTRQQIIADYRPALAMSGDVNRGEMVFRKTCSVCHKVGDVGHEVGPNLLSTRNRGTEFVLLNVLDPNREVLPAWHDYVAVLDDGRTTNGLVARESPVSVTLRQSEGKETSLLRANIDLLSDTGRSLMPEDLEKSVSVQQLADLLSWLYAQ